MRPCILALAVGFSLTAPAQANNAEHGRVLARKCSVCHGTLGISRDPEVANLAGQSAFYLEKSLKDFRAGIREDRRMTLVVRDLSDQDILDLAAWFASIEVTVRAPR